MKLRQNTRCHHESNCCLWWLPSHSQSTHRLNASASTSVTVPGLFRLWRGVKRRLPLCGTRLRGSSGLRCHVLPLSQRAHGEAGPFLSWASLFLPPGLEPCILVRKLPEEQTSRWDHTSPFNPTWAFGLFPNTVKNISFFSANSAKRHLHAQRLPLRTLHDTTGQGHFKRQKSITVMCRFKSDCLALKRTSILRWPWAG